MQSTTGQMGQTEILFLFKKDDLYIYKELLTCSNSPSSLDYVRKKKTLRSCRDFLFSWVGIHFTSLVEQGQRHDQKAQGATSINARTEVAVKLVTQRIMHKKYTSDEME